MGILVELSTLVDFTNVPWTCKSGVGSRKCAAKGGRVFFWGIERKAGPSTAPSLSLRLARDDKGSMKERE
jgi:hypothetical protein